jgi:hypothetical protein
MYCDLLLAAVRHLRVRLVPKSIKAELMQSRTGWAEASLEIYVVGIPASIHSQ